MIKRLTSRQITYMLNTTISTFTQKYSSNRSQNHKYANIGMLTLRDGKDAKWKVFQSLKDMCLMMANVILTQGLKMYFMYFEIVGWFEIEV